MLDNVLGAAAWAGIVADSCLDLADMATVLALQLCTAVPQSDGAVTLANSDGLTTSDAGGHLQQLGPSDLGLLADTIMQTAGEPDARGRCGMRPSRGPTTSRWPRSPRPS